MNYSSGCFGPKRLQKRSLECIIFLVVRRACPQTSLAAVCLHNTTQLPQSEVSSHTTDVSGPYIQCTTALFPVSDDSCEMRTGNEVTRTGDEVMRTGNEVNPNTSL